MLSFFTTVISCLQICVNRSSIISIPQSLETVMVVIRRPVWVLRAGHNGVSISRFVMIFQFLNSKVVTSTNYMSFDANSNYIVWRVRKIAVLSIKTDEICVSKNELNFLSRSIRLFLDILWYRIKGLSQLILCTPYPQFQSMKLKFSNQLFCFKMVMSQSKYVLTTTIFYIQVSISKGSLFQRRSFSL